ncbi:peptidoglycan-binding protein LysM [Succinimonas amylolytica]|uniref:peptidoglycan-binding protein LysM n=1 Tax=Succinimonas amylolytica TaxID=83769 RepID=UPI0023A86AE1
MGLISFVKGVGERLFGGKKPESQAADLKENMDALGLETSGLTVEMDGEKAVLRGNVRDQETLEKAALAVGNQVGVAEVDTGAVAVENTADESVFYTVQKGDTLWKIAESHYGKGNGAKYTVIFEANKPMLKDPDRIYPGQTLRIPKLD